MTFNTSAKFLVLAGTACGLASASAEASTITTIDLSSLLTLFSTSGGLLTSNGAAGHLLAAQGTTRSALLNFEISSLAPLTFDRVYLSLTEIRSGPFWMGQSNVYINDGTFPSQVLQGTTVDSATQQAFNNGLTFVTSVTGSGNGGTHVLLDVTAALQTALGSAMSTVGFYFKDEVDDLVAVNSITVQNGFGILGSNYNSGFPLCPDLSPFLECQYYAASLYEYPTLIAVSGTEITPFANLPARPILNDPTEPPDPTNSPELVPEPATLSMLAGAIAILTTARLRRRTTKPPMA